MQERNENRYENIKKKSKMSKISIPDKSGTRTLARSSFRSVGSEGNGNKSGSGLQVYIDLVLSLVFEKKNAESLAKWRILVTTIILPNTYLFEIYSN